MAKKDKINAEATTDESAVTTEKPRKKRGKSGEGVEPTKYKYVVKNRKARSELRQRKMVIIIAIGLLALLLCAGVIYGFFSALNVNNFSVYVQKSSSRALSLADNQSFFNATQVLDIVGPNKMDNTSLADYAANGDPGIDSIIADVINTDGQYSKDDDKFIAATFYVRNVTSDVVYYSEFLKIIECTNNVDGALRAMLIKDNAVSVYAKAKTDSKGNYILDESGNRIPEEVVPNNKGDKFSSQRDYPPLSVTTDEAGTASIVKDGENAPWIAEQFYDEEYVFYNKGFAINPGETVKYSIIIWLEGFDPNCTNDILDGKIRIEFAFEETVPIS